MQQLSVSGLVERITYHNPENGYCVVKLKCKGQKDLVTLVGSINAIYTGETVEAKGQWINHREFGLQFQANEMRTIAPQSPEGIERYLASGLIKGIGPHFAKKMVQCFGVEIFDIIDKAPQNLRRIEGIGNVRIDKITSGWKDQKAIREIMVFLQSHGVSTSRAVRIYKTYGQKAIEVVQKDPYQLARDVIGIGFKTADTIAHKLGIPKDSLIRARAGLTHVLLEKTGQGHCAYPSNELLEEAKKLLEIDLSILSQALADELGNARLTKENIGNTECIYVTALYRYECQVAQTILSLNHGKPLWKPKAALENLNNVEAKLKIQLAEKQKLAVQTALQSKVMILTGGPGTGKTTITRAILECLRDQQISLALCSPTGRASKRLSECTGLEAKTIHRLLGFDPKKGGFLHDRTLPIPADFILIDEASMVDLTLMYHLLQAIAPSTALLIIGDVDQIPSVGPGNVLASLIDSAQLPVVKLDQIFRQSAQSQIIQNAHLINQGQMPNLKPQGKASDFFFLQSESPEQTMASVLDLVAKRLPKAYGFHPMKDIQILCPMNRGGLGVRALNVELQKLLNTQTTNSIERFGTKFGAGDKVMVTSNDYDKEVYNGDMGYIESIDLEEQQAHIRFDEKIVIFEFSEFDILTLAYATTIHKAQGSEFSAVIIPMTMQHFLMLKRNLVYTAVTRGKKLVIMIGEPKALAVAIKSKNQGFRWNNLAFQIKCSSTKMGASLALPIADHSTNHATNQAKTTVDQVITSIPTFSWEP